MNNTNYLHRRLEETILKLFSVFPIVAITGPRQSGKSTLIQHIIDDTWAYYNLDNRETLLRIKNEPTLFVKSFQSNVVIDEAQKAPDLFHAIKELVDQQFPYKIILSGSANFLLMQSITESLAGRIGILELLPFSLSEWSNIKSNQLISTFLKTFDIKLLLNKLQTLPKNIEDSQLLNFILFGGYPKLIHLKTPEEKWIWLEQYITTYIERDLRSIAQVSNLDDFQKVYKMLAFQTGQIINKLAIGNDIGLNSATIKRYFSILETSYQCQQLPPFTANPRKQLIKQPKSFLYDTGIANLIMTNNSIDKMRISGSLGNIIETHIFSEIVKEIKYLTPKPKLYFWRTHNGAEVDFIIEQGNRRIPIEVKAGIRINPQSIRGLKSYLETEDKTKSPYGLVLYSGTDIYLIKENIIAIPIGLFY